VIGCDKAGVLAQMRDRRPRLAAMTASGLPKARQEAEALFTSKRPVSEP